MRLVVEAYLPPFSQPAAGDFAVSFASHTVGKHKEVQRLTIL